MRMQDSQANCGSTALYNALQALGIKRSMKECERLCGVTAQDGTSPENLLGAAGLIKGLHPRVLDTTDRLSAIAILHMELSRGRPVILSVDMGEHYITSLGLAGERILVADSAHNELVLSYKPVPLLERWGLNLGGTPYRFYGIIL